MGDVTRIFQGGKAGAGAGAMGGFGHLNYIDIKELSHKGGDARAPQNHPLATPLIRRKKILPSLVYFLHQT